MTQIEFCDYFDWIKTTIDIIGNSDENWVIRPHPSAKRWGEDQNTILKIYLLKSLDQKNQVIYFLIIMISNTDLFKRCNKLVTYSGTSHLEVGCFGVKSIIISDTVTRKFDKSLVHKPKNIEKYKELLLGKA